MTVDGNKSRRSLREYYIQFRPTMEEKGDFEETGDGYKYKSNQIFYPGDIVYVRANSSRNPENTNEAFAQGNTQEVLREAVIVMGRLWLPGKISNKNPESGKRILGLVKRNGYIFKNKTALNHPEVRKNYWKIVPPYVHRLENIKKRLEKYGRI